MGKLTNKEFREYQKSGKTLDQFLTDKKLDQKLADHERLVKLAKTEKRKLTTQTTYHRLEVLPMGAPRMTQRDRWAKRPVVLRYHQFKDDLRAEMKRLGIEVTNTIYLIYYLPMAKSWSKKKKAAYLGKPHHLKPDTDNITKGFKDALLKEDSEVYLECAAKYWSNTGEGYILFFNNLSDWVKYIQQNAQTRQ